MANIERLERVMNHIKDHPEHHYQVSWITHIEPSELDQFRHGGDTSSIECGMAACFAGWAAMLYAEELGYEQVSPTIFRPKGSREAGIHARTMAVEALELGDDDLGSDFTEAGVLFHAGNSRAALELIVKDLANGEDVVALRKEGRYRA